MDLNESKAHYDYCHCSWDKSTEAIRNLMIQAVKQASKSKVSMEYGDNGMFEFLNNGRFKFLMVPTDAVTSIFATTTGDFVICEEKLELIFDACMNAWSYCDETFTESYKRENMTHRYFFIEEIADVCTYFFSENCEIDRYTKLQVKQAICKVLYLKFEEMDVPEVLKLVFNSPDFWHNDTLDD